MAMTLWLSVGAGPAHAQVDRATSNPSGGVASTSCGSHVTNPFSDRASATRCSAAGVVRTITLNVTANALARTPSIPTTMRISTSVKPVVGVDRPCGRFVRRCSLTDDHLHLLDDVAVGGADLDLDSLQVGVRRIAATAPRLLGEFRIRIHVDRPELQI